MKEEERAMMPLPRQPAYYVAFFVIASSTIDEVKAKAPEALAAHLQRSQELHAQGKLLMAGALLDSGEEGFTTMGVFLTREAAEAYAVADPFVQNGMVTRWYIRTWANILQ
jgi:uncharacterized protein YciI